jgi:uncharacterized Zn finger protein
MTTRLRRGHAYFEEGRVVDFEAEPGGVRSIVRGSEEYRCEIYFEPLSNMEWNESLDRLAFQDLSAAALLTTGRMPPQIEDFFAPSGRKLLPQGESDLEFNCTCPDRAVPCKHLAATAYLLAEKLDSDPWLLFLLRGRSSQEVEQALVSRWNRDFTTEQRPSEEESPVRETTESGPSTNIDVFWANHLSSPILFPVQENPTKGLTLERMSVPEPKIEEKAWTEVVGAIYAEISKRAEEKLG